LSIIVSYPTLQFADTFFLCSIVLKKKEAMIQVCVLNKMTGVHKGTKPEGTTKGFWLCAP
jgi:hypothetical protein